MHCNASLVEKAEGLAVSDTDGLIEGDEAKGWNDGELEKITVGTDDARTEGLSVAIADGAAVGKVLGDFVGSEDDGVADDIDGVFDRLVIAKEHSLTDLNLSLPPPYLTILLSMLMAYPESPEMPSPQESNVLNLRNPLLKQS